MSDIYAPVSGEVAAVNEALSDTPELVNQDPYGDGLDHRRSSSPRPASSTGCSTRAAYRALIEG